MGTEVRKIKEIVAGSTALIEMTDEQRGASNDSDNASIGVKVGTPLHKVGAKVYAGAVQAEIDPVTKTPTFQTPQFENVTIEGTPTDPKHAARLQDLITAGKTGTFSTFAELQAEVTAGKQVLYYNHVAGSFPDFSGTLTIPEGKSLWVYSNYDNVSYPVNIITSLNILWSGSVAGNLYFDKINMGDNSSLTIDSKLVGPSSLSAIINRINYGTNATITMGDANLYVSVLQKSASGGFTFVGNNLYYEEILNTTSGDITGSATQQFWKTPQDITKQDDVSLSINTDFDLVTYTAANGSVLKLGYDDVIPFYNDTGVELAAGTYMHLLNVTTVGSEYLATFEKTDASDWEKIQGTIGATTNIVPIGGTGFIAPKGQIPHVDTSGVSAPAQIWLSATVPGGFTDVEPEFPNYPISVGGAINSAVDGNLLVNITGDYKETFHSGWDGAIRETFNFRVRAAGGVITGTLENVDPTLNLTGLFSAGFLTIDTTTTPKIITSVGADGLKLVAGTDEDTQTNYVYMLKGDATLRVSTTSFPTTEHSKIATLELQSIASIVTDGGARGNQNHNDHIKTENGNGHVLHAFDWMRDQYATADTRRGCEVTLDSTAGNGYFTMTSGTIRQAHFQTLDSIIMPTSPIMVTNDFTTPYVKTTNLNTITAYSDGSAWGNKWSKVVVWVMANKTGEPDFLALNLPSDGYSSEANALSDNNNYANYSMPIKYKGKAALLGVFVVKINGGVVTYNGGYEDLRGTIPSNIAGGGGGGAGVSSYLALTDTPSSFVGQAGRFPQVNVGENALEFTDNVVRNSGQLVDVDLNNKQLTNVNRLGVGTATADEEIHVKVVNPEMKLEDTDSLKTAVSASTSYYGTDGRAGFIGFSGGDMFFATDDAGADVIWRLAGTQKMILAANGVLTLPDATVAEIEAAGAKAVVTNEVLNDARALTWTQLGTSGVYYAKRSGIVYFSGEQNTTSGNTVVGYLPTGFRPKGARTGANAGLYRTTLATEVGALAASLFIDTTGTVFGDGAGAVYLTESTGGANTLFDNLSFIAEQ
jgi:hypothetical protein